MKVKANRILLNKVNAFVYQGQNVWVPMGEFRKKDLQEAMDKLADDVVEITFKVHPSFLEADLKMFGTRFDGVSGWEFTPVETPRLSPLATREEVVGSSERRYFAIRKPGTPSRDSLKSAAKVRDLKERLRSMEQSSGTGHNIAVMNRVRAEIEKLEGKQNETA